MGSRGHLTVALAAGALALVAGCESSSSSVAGKATSDQAQPSGAVAGRFQEVGGPELPNGGTQHHSLQGTIVVHRQSATGAVVATTTVTQNGLFKLNLPPGSYFLVGRTPQITGTGGGCPSFHAFHITADTTTRTQVVCEVP
jgi:hypothetical protein